MSFVMDRELQGELLRRMQAVYPAPLGELMDVAWDTAVPQLAYLEGQGLCESGLSRSMSGNFHWKGSTITARGLDFLADDGGLSAILGVFTIKLHAETVRELLAAKIEASGLPDEKRRGLLAVLSRLPEAALQEGARGLMRLGVNNIGDVESWLHTLPGMFGL